MADRDRLRGLSKFQSTLSMRRATVHSLPHNEHNSFQSTLSMRRATKPHGNVQFYVLISIHALHEESDNSYSDV